MHELKPGFGAKAAFGDPKPQMFKQRFGAQGAKGDPKPQMVKQRFGANGAFGDPKPHMFNLGFVRAPKPSKARHWALARSGGWCASDANPRHGHLALGDEQQYDAQNNGPKEIMPTPHISAAPGDFAEVTLMPGDPLRAEYVAKKFLQDARLVTAVRNMYGFTGTYRGKRISVMGHGMGIPSCSIYATELVREYGVRVLIRVGSCGALASTTKLGDIILAMGGSTDSKVNRMRFLDHDFAAIADYELLATAAAVAKEHQIPIRVGNVLSTDFFYHPQENLLDVAEKMGILALEMEVAGLYGVAAEYGARALGMLTVSDHLRRHEHLSVDERQTSFESMMRIALETAVRVQANT